MSNFTTVTGMTPVGAAFAVGGAILGAIGMSKKRKAARRKRRAQKEHALKAQKQLLGSVSEIRKEYAERAGFGRQEYLLKQQQGMLGYTQNLRGANQAIGQTGLAYGGGAEREKSSLEQSYTQERQAQKLGYKEGFWGLEREFEGELRGIQKGLLDIERIGAERGYDVPGRSIDTKSNLGGYK